MNRLEYIYTCNYLYITQRVFDGRTKRGGQQCNFYIHYEVDDDEVPTVLQLEDYGGEEEGCWLLLQPTAV